MTERLAAVAVLGAALLTGNAAWTHGAVHERIATLTQRIITRPNDAELLVERAELHALDQNWTQAAEDLVEALAIAPERAEVMHRLADAKLHLGDATEALRLAEASLARRADDPRALLVRARAHDQLGSHAAAVRDLTGLIASSDTPSPELYVERARIQERAGDDAGAVEGLRDGVARLGPLVTLIEPAATIEAHRGRPEAALALVDQLDRRLVSTPRWLARKGELTEQAGRRHDAKEAYEAALAALERLPESRRRAPRHVALRSRVQARLDQLPRVDVPSPGPEPWRSWLPLGALVAGAALGFVLQKR